MNLQPFLSIDSCTLYHGDSLSILRDLPAATVDAVVTDPPYSSGGMHRGDRMTKTSDKYVMNGSGADHPEFFGDTRDQRGFLAWASFWLADCWRITKPGGILLMFIDWRQLPIATDAIQAGGWLWRGIIPWDKTEATRPQKGWFRAQAEYVLSATKGSLGAEQGRAGPCLPGVFRHAVNSEEKHHMTGKPVRLLRDIMRVVPPAGVVLDPFAGGGSTLLAARDLGHRSIGIEMSAEYCARIADRFRQSTLELGVAS